MNKEDKEKLYYILSDIGKVDSYENLEKFIDDRDKKYIDLIEFLRKQVTDSCCHSMLDEDDTVEKIDEILRK